MTEPEEHIDENPPLGPSLRHLRLRLGLRLKDVAPVAGRGASWLCNVEAGRYQPTLDELRALLKELDIAERKRHAEAKTILKVLAVLDKSQRGAA